jgi:hypothetical protein
MFPGFLKFVFVVKKNYRICSGVIRCLFLEIAREIYSFMDRNVMNKRFINPTELFFESCNKL